MSGVEVNFDGLIGPTHHYGGLAPGNLASQRHARQVSHPRQAALQGLEKMKLLADRGIPQAVLPPHERPHLEYLQQRGFGQRKAEELIPEVARRAPEILSTAWSASAMWAANAATISPSSDTVDGRVHITPANLVRTTHRSLEAAWTTILLRQLFSDSRLFAVHDPLPSRSDRSDEGAANQMRLSNQHGDPGIEIFVYGRDPTGGEAFRSRKFAPRQSKGASQEMIRQHGLSDGNVLLVQQLPAAIDAGVFHNDVIAVANENLLLCHEQAFVNQPAFLRRLQQLFPGSLCILEASEAELSLEEAVRTYLFNSQLVTLPSGGMLLLCPQECETSPQVQALLPSWQSRCSAIQEVQYVDVRQSMRNGGGPACLRLRVVLTDHEWDRVHSGVKLTDALYQKLKAWIETHYRESLSRADLADPLLIGEVRTALDELTKILNLGNIYPFQLAP